MILKAYHFFHWGPYNFYTDSITHKVYALNQKIIIDFKMLYNIISLFKNCLYTSSSKKWYPHKISMNKYNHLSNTFKGRQGFQTFFKFMEKAIKHLLKKKMNDYFFENCYIVAYNGYTMTWTLNLRHLFVWKTGICALWTFEQKLCPWISLLYFHIVGWEKSVFTSTRSPPPSLVHL